jgi:hypothetical protein
MRCPKAKDYISQAMDEHLPPDVTMDLTKHLDACADCREYREDLKLASKALSATTCELPDNFEWKLQLRLNQALQQAAGETGYPWSETERDKWRWLRNFGAAAAVGMAAVLALAMFLGPVGRPDPTGRIDGTSGSAAVVSAPVESPFSAAGSSDRLPLGSSRSLRGGGLYNPGIQRSVSAGGSSRAAAGLFDRGWSGHNTDDLRTIQRLRNTNNQLNQVLYRQQMMLRGMKTQLDSINGDALDLEQE